MSKVNVIGAFWGRDNLKTLNDNFKALDNAINDTENRIFNRTWEATKEINTIEMLEPVQSINDLPEDAKPKSLVTVLDNEKVYAFVESQWQAFSEIDLDPFSPFKDELKQIIDDYETKIKDITTDVNNAKNTAIDTIESTQNATESHIKKSEQTAINTINEVQQEAEKEISTVRQELKDKTTEFTTKFNNYLSQLTDNKNASLDAIEQAKQEALGSLENEDIDNMQKYKLTSDDGSRIYLSKGSFDNILDLAPGFYETVVNDGPVSQGFPDFFSNAPFVQIDVTYGNNGRKQFKVVQSFNGQTVYRYIHTDGKSDSGWLEIMTKKTLYDGEVEDANSEFELDGNPGDYSYLIIDINHIGGDDAVIAKAKNNSFVFRAFNLGNSAKGVTLMETTCTVSGSNPSIAKISNSVRVESDTATGKDYVPKILKIVGVK